TVVRPKSCTQGSNPCLTASSSPVRDGRAPSPPDPNALRAVCGRAVCPFQLPDRTAEMTGMRAMLSDDVRFGWRVLRRSPGFTLVATVSLALAIGANTTIFSVAKRLLFDRLDVPDAAGLRLLAETDRTGTDPNISYPVYEQLRAQRR